MNRFAMEKRDGGLRLVNPMPSVTDDLVVGSFSRYGGISPPPYDEHNISYGVGDVPENVTTNRRMIKEQFGIDYLISAHQVHGDTIHCLDAPVRHDHIIPDCDALVTDQVGVGLLIGHADCQAVMVSDPKRGVIAGIHNGWRGSVINIIGQTIQRMTSEYRARPENMHVVIGPSLGPCCAEFVNHERELPKEFSPFQVAENHFDFWEISRNQLTSCGIFDENIHTAKVCTSCSQDFFSYRRSRRNGSAPTGRNGSVISRKV